MIFDISEIVFSCSSNFSHNDLSTTVTSLEKESDLLPGELMLSLGIAGVSFSGDP